MGTQRYRSPRPLRNHQGFGDDTLRFYLSKSDAVVVGKIVNAPIGVTSEIGVIRYICEVEVQDVLKGGAELPQDKLRVSVQRFERGANDRHPLIAKDETCIFFLTKRKKGSNPRWGSADFWFALQHPSPLMAQAIKRLAL